MPIRDPKHHLSAVDPVLGRLIKKIELRPQARRGNYFQALVVAIINQQLSGKAAATIEKRFRALFAGTGKFPTPEQVLAMPAKKMRTAGLSGSKVLFIKDLARHVAARKLNFRAMKKLPDEEIIVALTEVKGIGRWSAEMFLMSALQRPDIFSYGDLGLRNAIQKWYKLRAHPTPKQAEKITARWQPHRTLASRYLWASLDLND